MFELLSKVLLAVLVASMIWFILSRFVRPVFYTVIGVLALVTFIVLALVSPSSDGTIADVWQILSLPLKPLGLSLILLATAILQGLPLVREKSLFRDKKFVGFNVVLKDAVPQIIAATLILLVFSLPLVAQKLAIWIEREGMNLISSNQPLLPVMVLLGRDSTQNATFAKGSPIVGTQIQQTGNRVAYTAAQYAEQRERGNRPQIIICARAKEGEQIEADDIGFLLIRMGVPEGNIIAAKTTLVTTATEPDFNPRPAPGRRDPICDGTSILASARSVKQILNDRGLGNRVMLIMPAMNTYRAIKAFQHQGISVTARPTDFQGIGVAPGRLLRRIIPRAEALALSTRATDEFWANLYYYLRDR